MGTRLRTRWVLLGAAVLLAPGGVVPAALVPSAALAAPAPEALAAARAELSASTEAMVQAVAALREAEAALPLARAAAEQAGADLAAAETAYAEAVDQQTRAQTELVLAGRRREEQSAVASGEQDRLDRLVRGAYVAGSLDPGAVRLALVLDARSPAELSAGFVSVDRAVAAQRRVVEDVSAAVVGMRADERELTGRREAVFVRAAQAERALAEVAARRAAADLAVANVDALVAERRTAEAAAQAALAEDEARHAELQAEAQALAKRLTGRDVLPHVAGAVPAVPGLLQRPVTGRVSSPYGMRTHPITGVHKLHTGTDFAVACGTPVAAAAGGEVLSAGFHRAYGNRVVLAHAPLPGGERLVTTYNHLERVDVAQAQVLAPGERLGTVGSTGYSTGCHLHFEVFAGTGYVDPAPWLPR